MSLGLGVRFSPYLMQTSHPPISPTQEGREQMVVRGLEGIGPPIFTARPTTGERGCSLSNGGSLPPPPPPSPLPNSAIRQTACIISPGQNVGRGPENCLKGTCAAIDMRHSAAGKSGQILSDGEGGRESEPPSPPAATLYLHGFLPERILAEG
jgi:hypothetical protein